LPFRVKSRKKSLPFRANVELEYLPFRVFCVIIGSTSAYCFIGGKQNVEKKDLRQAS
jgi:hypothetical protein